MNDKTFDRIVYRIIAVSLLILCFEKNKLPIEAASACDTGIIYESEENKLLDKGIDEADQIEPLAGTNNTGTCGDNITWTLADGVLSISGSGDMHDYSYNEKAPWEDSGSDITRVVIGSGVTHIGDYAFYWYSMIEQVTLPEGLESIGTYSFYHCTSLANITIPSTVNQIGEGAFCMCSSMTDVSIPKGVTVISDYLFDSCTSLENIDIPEGIVRIGNSAFSGCKKIKTVKISDSVTEIGYHAFSECYLLDNVVIPGSVKTVGGGMFSSCGSLSNVVIQPGLPEISAEMFEQCHSLRTIDIPSSVTVIDSDAFYNSGVENVNLAFGVETIGPRAFKRCGLLKSISLPDSITGLSVEAFSGSGLESILIPSSMDVISIYDFYSCSALKYVIIPKSVTAIGEKAFLYCSKLADVYYLGTEEDWEKIEIYKDNEPLTSANIHFNSKIEDVSDPQAEDKKYNEYKGHYYEVFRTELTWEKAKEYCESVGGYLVTIGDEYENSFVYGLMRAAGYKSAWIGLKATSNGIEPTPSPTGQTDTFLWKWVTGEFANKYSNWAEGEGNAQNGEIYGMFYEKYSDGKWNDGTGEQCRFICEWDYNPINDPAKIEEEKAKWKQLLSHDSTEYNAELAKVAADFSKACEDAYDKGEGYLMSKYMSYGFAKDDIDIVDYNQPTSYSIASMPLGMFDGEPTSLVVITARGTKTTIEGIWDATGSTSENAVFRRKVFDYPKDFEEEIWYGMIEYFKYHEELADCRLKFLVNGHSLGGAAANLVAARLTQYSNGNWANKEDIYAYTFGALNSITAYCPEIDNIHNIYNWYDTFGPNGSFYLHYGDKIGSIYGKFGHIHFFGTSYGDDNFIPVINNSTPNHNIETYIDALNGKTNVSPLNTVCNSCSMYGHTKCPVDITIYKDGNIVGRTIDNVVDDSVTSIPLYSDNGEKSYWLDADNGEYEIRFHAFDDGEMEHSILSFSQGTSKAVEYKNVSLNKDKEMIQVLGGDGIYSENRLYVIDSEGLPVKEVLGNGTETEYSKYGDLLESDIPADGNIPDGIWIAGIEDLIFNGKKQTQDFRVYDGVVLLEPKTDYSVSYKNNQKAYTIADPDNPTAADRKAAPQMIITMKGNYSGKETVYFSIRSSGRPADKPAQDKTVTYPVTGDKITITDVAGNAALSAVFNKSGAKPELRIMHEDTILKEGRDYTLKFSGNTAYPAAKASVTITGKGNYTGKKTIPFTVTQRSFSESSGITVVATDKAEGKRAGQFNTTVKVFDSEGKLLKAGTDYDRNIIYLKDGKELANSDFPKANEIITVKVTGKGGYTDNSIETTYTIVTAGQINDIGKATIKIKDQKYDKGNPVMITSQEQIAQAYVGKSKTPLTISTDGGSTGDYMAVPGSYVKNLNKGTAKVTFMGINGKTGTKTVSFKIGPRSLADCWRNVVRAKKYYQTNAEILELVKQYCADHITDAGGNTREMVEDYFFYQLVRSSDLGNGLYAFCVSASVYRTYHVEALILPDGTIYDLEKDTGIAAEYNKYFSFDITQPYSSGAEARKDPTFVEGGYGIDSEPDDDRKSVISKWSGTFRLDEYNTIEVLNVYDDGRIQFRFTVLTADGENTVTNTYTGTFTNDAWTEFSIPYQSGVNEIFRLEENGIRVLLDIDMQGANDGLYVKNRN